MVNVAPRKMNLGDNHSCYFLEEFMTRNKFLITDIIRFTCRKNASHL